ncbi:MAG: sulfite exporter TauE/SafE family protein, partial [Planctomycetota bacterium]
LGRGPRSRHGAEDDRRDQRTDLAPGHGTAARVATKPDDVLEQNGTLRVAVLFQNIVGLRGYARGGAVPWREVRPLIAPIVFGAVAGAWAATEVSSAAMRRAFAIAVVLVALSALVDPAKWTSGGKARLRGPWRTLSFVGIGLYGGFVQAGVGFPLLAGLVLGMGFDLVRGNAAKVLLILCYAPAVLLLFARADQVHWTAGLVLAAGSMGGAFTASRLAVREGASRWIRWVVVVAAVGAALRMLLAG